MSSVSINPFPGLRPFRMDEKFLFFGREQQTQELLQRLRDNRFLAVVGTSGSGKSSLVQAGLLPQLYGGTMLEAGFHWEVAVMRPGGDPLTHLAEALVETDLYDPERVASVLETRATLRRSGLGLVEAVRQSDIEPGTNLLIVVDQFEEIFRFRRSGHAHLAEAGAFVKLLLKASQQSEIPIYIALTMRSDYLGDCSEFAGLAEAVNQGEYLIPRLSRKQRRSAIEGPVKVGGGELSTRLLQTLLNDVGDNPDHLPVLQHALMRTWDHWKGDHSENESIDLRHYESVGGMAEALSRHADEVFDELPDDHHRAVAGKMFKALTERSLDNRGIRRPASLSKLCAVADADEEMVVSIIAAFRKPGRTFVMPGENVELQPETIIDISHESLMRVWKRLDGWVEEESQSAQIYGRLRETAELHAEGQAGLFHDPDLQIARSWREDSRPNAAWAEQYGAKFDLTLAFLDQSQDAASQAGLKKEAERQRELDQAKTLADTQQRAARNFKRFAVGMASVALAALLAFVFALAQEKKADASAAMAKGAEAAAREGQYISDMGLAQHAITTNDLGRARALLEAHKPSDGEPDLRGWEWRYLHGQSQGDESASLGPFPGAIDTVDSSRDGRWLGISETVEPGRLSIWDAQTKRVVLERELGSVCFAFSPTEDLVVFTNLDDTISRIRLGDDQELEEKWDVGGSPTYHLAFSPDGKKIALFVGALGGDQQVELRDIDHGTELIPPIAISGEIHNPQDGAVTLSERFLIIGDGDGKTYVHSIEDGELVFPPFPHPEAISSLAVNKHETLLATGTRSSEADIRLWDLDTGALRETLQGHLTWVSKLEFTPDGSQLISSSSDQTLRIWEMDPLKLGQSQIVRGNVDEIYTSTLSSSGSQVITGSKDGWVRFFDLEKLKSRPFDRVYPVFDIPGAHLRQATAFFDFSPNEPLLVAIGTDERAFLIDTNTLEKTRDLPALGNHLRGVLFYPDGDRLLATNVAGEFLVYDFASDQLVERIPTKYPAFMPMAFSADTRLITTAANGLGIIGWDSEPFSVVKEGNFSLWAVAEVISFDQLALSISGDQNPQVGLFNPMKPSFDMRRFRTGGNRALSSLAVTEDQRFLMGTDWAGFVSVWDLQSQSQNPETRFSSQRLAAYRVASFQSDERLATGGLGNDLLKVWHFDSTKQPIAVNELLTLDGKGRAKILKVSPDNTTIALSSEFRREGHLNLWRAPLDKEIERTRKLNDVYPPGKSNDAWAMVKALKSTVEDGGFVSVQKRWKDFVERGRWAGWASVGSAVDAYCVAAAAEVRRLREAGNKEASIGLLREVILAQAFNRSGSRTLATLLDSSSAHGSILVARGSVWKHLDDGSELGTDWRTPEYDDAKWKEGPASLGSWGYVAAKVVATQIQGRQEMDGLTNYFRHRFEMPGSARHWGLLINLLRDDGAIVYLNGVEIVRSNMPAGFVTARTEALSNIVGDSAIYRPHRVPSGDLLHPGTNVIAVEVHQSSSASPDVLFDLSLSRDSTAPYLIKLIDELGNDALLELMRNTLPKPLQNKWMRHFIFVTEGETLGAPGEIPDWVWIMRFDYLGDELAQLETADQRLKLLESEGSSNAGLIEEWMRRKQRLQAEAE